MGAEMAMEPPISKMAVSLEVQFGVIGHVSSRAGYQLKMYPGPVEIKTNYPRYQQKM
jgi:hypothetical protein